LLLRPRQRVHHWLDVRPVWTIGLSARSSRSAGRGRRRGGAGGRSALRLDLVAFDARSPNRRARGERVLSGPALPLPSPRALAFQPLAERLLVPLARQPRREQGAHGNLGPAARRLRRPAAPGSRPT